MDDQRPDRTVIRSVIRGVRMIALMYFCAAIGNLPRVGNMVPMAEQRFKDTLIGAFCGLGVEMCIRAFSKK